MSDWQQRKNDPEYRKRVYENNKRWLAKHRQQRAQYLRKYNQAHRGERAGYASKWRNSKKGRRWAGRYFPAYRQAHSKERAKYSKKYYRKHRAECAERARLFRTLHPEFQRRANARYHKRHLKLCRERAKLYWQKAVRKNPHLAREKNSQYRCRKKGLPVGRISREQYQSIWRAFKSRCAFCGRGGKLTADHLRPLGTGLHITTNIVPACMRCNVSKFNRRWRAWFQRQEFFSREREKKILQHAKKGV